MSWLIAFLVSLVFAIRLYLDFRRLLGLYKHSPGLRTIFGVNNIVVSTLVRREIRGVIPGSNGTRAFLHKHEDFKYFGQDVIINISAFPSASAVCWVADAAAIKDIIAVRHKFPKPLERYKILSFFGNNIVTSGFDEWKKYRKICAPAFNERNFQLVWDETVKNSVALFDNVWGPQNEVAINNCVDFVMSLALFVIASAGFGRQVSWG